MRWCQCGVFDNRSWHQDYTTQTIRVKTKHNKLNQLIIIVFVILIRSLAKKFDFFTYLKVLKYNQIKKLGSILKSCIQLKRKCP